MEVLNKLLAMSFWERFVNFHGLLAMLSLVLFGTGIILYFVVKKNDAFFGWFKKILFFLFANLALLDIAGLLVYMPYRASGGPRTILRASESTAWLHNVIFEHKEFLAFAPPILIMTAYLVTQFLGKDFNSKAVLVLRRSVIVSLLASLILVLLVAAEATLVVKAAPLK